MEIFATPSWLWPGLYGVGPSLRERVKCCHAVVILTPGVMPYHTDLAAYKRPDGSVEWHTAASEFVTMALERFLHAAGQNVVGFQF